MLMQVNEPVRRSLLDVLQDYLKVAQRNIFLHRIIYIGDHTFQEVENKSVQDKFRMIINEVNSEYCDEVLTGILIYYPRYFCHVVEGSEDSIIKHLRILTERCPKHLGRMKLLTAYHHINQRFLPEWTCYTGKPPTLLEKIDVTSGLSKTYRQVAYCINKVYNLADNLRPKVPNEENPSITTDFELTSMSDQRTIKDRRSTTQSGVDRYLSTFLPEYNLLEFLLQNQYVQNLHTYISTYEHLPEMEAYEDTVWPVPTDLVPYDVFDKPYDPVTDLPPRQSGNPDEVQIIETTTNN